LPYVLGLEVPNILPDVGFLRPAGRLIWFTLIFVVLTVGAILVIRTPKKSAEPATWAATIVGAMSVWVWITLAYAIIPHEWLNFSASYLNFGKDSYALRRNVLIPTDVTRLAVGESIAAGIYVVMLVLNVRLFVLWQKRKVAEPATDAAEGDAPATGGPLSRLRGRTSAYGRPVTTTEA